MARFIETDRGLVNLDHVSTMRTPNDLEKYESRTVKDLFGRDGELLGRSHYSISNDDFLPVVPATAGQVAVILSVDDLSDPPEIEDVFVMRWPIVAWRIRPNSVAEAILPEEVSPGEWVLIECPDGVLLYPFVGEFTSLEKAKKEALLSAMKQYQRKKIVAGTWC